MSNHRETQEAIELLLKAKDCRGVPIRLHIGPITSRSLMETLRRQLSLAVNGGPVFVSSFTGPTEIDKAAEATYWEHVGSLSNALAAAIRAGV